MVLRDRRPPQALASEPGASPPDPWEGRILDGRYRLEQRLGEGASGVVYSARHLALQKGFAVKLLKTAAPGAVSLARFRREAEALGRLRHPHIVEVTDFGLDGAGIPYLVMELLDGVPLADLCRAGDPLPLEQALPLLEAIASAVDAAHERGILHRDLKPGNVLLAETAEGGLRVKVLDFGLAELAAAHADAAAPPAPAGVDPGERAAEDGGERLTATGALLGTPLCVAPELIRQGAASRASDVYAFGVLAYELLAGRPPFQGSTAEVLAGHLEEEPPRPAPPGKALPEEVWRALQEPLAKDPARRPPGAGEVVRRLRRAAQRAALARWRAAEVPRRLRLSALPAAAVLLFGFLPGPGLPAADLWLQDLRVRAAPVRPPDPDILLITFDEASLAEGPSLAERADEAGRLLSRLMAAGARGVAVDLLLPAQWSASPAFSEFVLRHSDTITLAAFSRPDGSVAGAECVAGLTAAALGPERTSRLFGFVNLDEDPDGVIRRGRLGYRDRDGGIRPSWAGRAAAALRPGRFGQATAGGFWLDPRIDWQRFVPISWRDVPAALDRYPGLFRGRMILVGGDFRGSGDDYNQIPHRSGVTAVSGLTLQALLVNTIVAGLPVREAPRAPVLAGAALLTALAAAGVLCARRAGPPVAALALAATLYAAISFPVFARAGLMLPVTLPLLAALLGLVLALALRRWLPPAPEVSP